MIPALNQSAQRTKPVLKIPVIEFNCKEQVYFHLIGIYAGLLGFVPEVDVVDVSWEDFLVGVVFHVFGAHLGEGFAEKF